MTPSDCHQQEHYNNSCNFSEPKANQEISDSKTVQISDSTKQNRKISAEGLAEKLIVYKSILQNGTSVSNEFVVELCHYLEEVQKLSNRPSRENVEMQAMLLQSAILETLKGNQTHYIAPLYPIPMM